MADRRQTGPLETPVYVYDLDEVRRNHATLRAALPDQGLLFYSLKANPHPAIVAALGALGCGAEVCSPGELAVARAVGLPADRILYTGPGKRDAEVAEAIAAGVRWFSVDSPHGLDQVDRAADRAAVGARCLLRVNDKAPAPGQGLTMTGVASQFGADAEWIEAEPKAFRSRPAAVIAGFHLYMGSNVAGVDALATQFGTAAGTARRLRDLLDVDLRLLNLGGGFGAPFGRAGRNADLSGLADRIGALLAEAFPGWPAQGPPVAFESGRFLTATAGCLLTRVLDVKRSHGQPVVVLESGINHLGGMSGLRRLPPLVPDLFRPTADPAPADGTADPAPAPAPAPADGTGPPGGLRDRAVGDGEAAGLTAAIVAGPLCTPLDTWARSANLPDVRPGDVLRVPNVGAYGLTASLLAFLGHPAPREVVLDGGRVVDSSRLTLVRLADLAADMDPKG